MTLRRTSAALFAAVLIAGSFAASASAATHHAAHRPMAHRMAAHKPMRHMAHPMSARRAPMARGGDAQNATVDQLNAQSLQRAQGQ